MRAEFVHSPWLDAKQIAIARPVPGVLPTFREHPAPSDDVIIMVPTSMDATLAGEIERMVEAHNTFDSALDTLQHMTAQVETAKLSALIKALSRSTV